MLGAKRFGALAKLLPPLIASIAGWLFIAPLAVLVPKRRDWVAVIGRQDGRFLDNAKYFFLQADALEPEVNFFFITERKEIQQEITKGGLKSICYPSLRGGWFLLRCKAALVDESNWFRNGRRFLLARSAVVQLWHGVGFKRIEYDRWKNETGSNSWASKKLFLNLRLAYYSITGRWIRFFAVITTSEFYKKNVFTAAFSARKFVITGYPRNDFALSLKGKHLELAWSNVDTKIKQMLPHWKQMNKRLVMVAPTFRDMGGAPMRLDNAMLKKIDAFAAENDVEFIFKFHPSESDVDRIAGEHFHVCARDSDIYPLFPYFSALVTDYSSISMDFLLADKPVLYLIPEGDDYVKKDRQLQFDPRGMMPGPIASDWEGLMIAIIDEWHQDGYKKERALLCNKAFDALLQSASVPEILALMRKDDLIS